MARTYFQDWTLDDEREVTVEFTVIPGRPETGPTYACGGTPAEPPEIEIVAIVHNGAAIGVAGGLGINTDEEEKIILWLTENFEDDDEPDPDDWRDYQDDIRGARYDD